MIAAALPTVVVHAPKADLTLEVARTESELRQGLMYRPELRPRSGMIFVFKSDGPIAFWMKNTRIPLDMIFLAPDGTVRRVFANVAVVDPALPDEAIPREAATAKFVIELRAGEAARDGISAGTKLDVRGVPPPP